MWKICPRSPSAGSGTRATHHHPPLHAPRAGASVVSLLPLMIQGPWQGLGGLFWVPSSPNRGTALCKEGALNHPELAPVLSNRAVTVRGWSVQEAAPLELQMQMNLQLLM